MIASLYLEQHGVDPLDGKQVSWHPMKVFLPPEEQFQVSMLSSGDEVFILDYSGGVEFVCAVAAGARRVTVLDHHLTAISSFRAAEANRSIPPNLHVEFDVQRCGATLALDYFSRRLGEESRAAGASVTLADAAATAAGVAEAEARQLALEVFAEGGAAGDVCEPCEASCEMTAAMEGSFTSDATDFRHLCAEQCTGAATVDGGTKSSKRRRKRPGRGQPAKALGRGGHGAGATSATAQAPTPSAVAVPKATEAPVSGSYGALLARGGLGAEALLRLVRLMEDADLYRWWLQDSREFHAGLGALRLNYDVRSNPGLFARLRGLDVATVAAAGKAVLQREESRIEKELNRTFVLAVPEVGVRCFGVRTSFPELRSTLGHALAARSMSEGLGGLGVVAYATPELEAKGLIKVSVRGAEGANTLAFTERFGGGGHLTASSCNVLKFIFDSWCED